MPYTSHGHAYGLINADEPRPTAIARCGGPRLCRKCAQEAGRDPRPSRAYRRYRKRPVEVEAVRWTGDNEAELRDFAGEHFLTVDAADRDDDPDQTAAVFDTLHNTWVRVYDGQWIVKGVKGEFYPVAPDVFAETYEPVPAALPSWVVDGKCRNCGRPYGDSECTMSTRAQRNTSEGVL